MSASAVAPGSDSVAMEGVVEEPSSSETVDNSGGSAKNKSELEEKSEATASSPKDADESTPSSSTTDPGISSNQESQSQAHQTPAVAKSETQSESQASGRSTPSHPPGSEPKPAVEPSSSSTNRPEGPLPQNLRRILLEVAKTGACSWLPWDQDAKEHHLVMHHHSNEGSGALNMLHNSTPASSNSYMLNKSLSGFTTSAQPFSTHRRSTSSPYPSGASQPRKSSKQRNGLHKRRRYMGSDGSNTQTTTSRKRPLFLIRTNPNNATSASTGGSGGAGTATQTATATAGAAAANPGSVYSAGSIASSVGSGRTSGSEPDDSTQYECDSEGTSATTNSEVSVEGRIRKRNAYVHHGHGIARMKHPKGGDSNLNTDTMEDEDEPSMSSNGSTYTTLQGAFRIALQLVLDHFYRHCGGYKLSPAERRRIAIEMGGNNESSDNNNAEQQRRTISSDTVFQQRRQRLASMLSPKSYKKNKHEDVTKGPGPPFTIQRIAEVLVSPERYYTQTHKLCNCLEKLLLVSSSTEAFGGITGGKTAQSRREELEMAALADERARQEKEMKERRLKRRASSPMDESNNDGAAESRMVGTEDEVAERRRQLSPDKRGKEYGPNGSPNGKAEGDGSTREKLEAAARASLRTKFDHVGIDPHSSPDRDVRSIAESRGMTSSPPPPMASTSSIPLPGHGVSGFVRQHDQNPDNPSIARVPSPIMFSQTGGDPDMHNHSSSPNMHMLQLHHAAALAGVGNSRPPTHLDLALHDKRQGNLAGGTNPDLENEHGRSSASNSDVDSESDDLSLDDSASDRSDGSDSGSLPHYEPFTAARAMALNRMQQQQRLQSRNLTSFNLHQSGFRPPADSEYQSGDSIDSMRAEDSGSDSSSVSSDIAD